MNKKYSCYYCGILTSGIDHVIPKAILQYFDNTDISKLQPIIKNRILTIPCCTECNHLLGANYQRTLKERKLFLKQKLRKRYKKILNLPNWNENEIKELKSHLQQFVRKGIEEKRIIKERLKW